MGKISDNSMDALFDGLTIDSVKEDSTQRVPISPTKKADKSKQPCKKESFLVRFSPDVLDKARLISGAHRIHISEIIEFALRDYIDKYEKKYGVIELSGHKSAADLLI